MFSARLGCELEASVPRDTRLRTVFHPGAWCRGKRCLGSCGSLGACPGLCGRRWVVASSGRVRLPRVHLRVSPTTNMPRGRTAFVWFSAAVVKLGHPWWGAHRSPTVLLSRGRGSFKASPVLAPCSAVLLTSDQISACRGPSLCSLEQRTRSPGSTCLGRQLGL